MYEYEEVHALKPQKLLLNEKNKQLELVQERSLEIRRQDEDEAYQAKNNKIEKEIVAIRQKVHKLQLEKEELQSMLQVGEASSSNKLQVCAFYSEVSCSAFRPLVECNARNENTTRTASVFFRSSNSCSQSTERPS